MGLVQCQSVIIFARTDEQTFTAALSLADYVPRSAILWFIWKTSVMPDYWKLTARAWR